MTELTPAEKGAITKRINKERAIVEELELGEGEILVRNDDTGEIGKCVNSTEELEAQAAEGFKPWTPEWMEAEGDDADTEDTEEETGEAGPGDWPRDDAGKVIFTCDVTATNKHYDDLRCGVQFRNGVGTTTCAQNALRLVEAGLPVSPHPLAVSAAAGGDGHDAEAAE